MTIATKIFALLFVALCMSTASGVNLDAAPAKAEVQLAEGSSDISVGDKTVRVVRAHVGTSNAHSYETFTGFLLPRHSGDPWLHVMVDEPDGTRSDFRTVESADSTVQAIAIYRDHNRLFVVQATKGGIGAPDLYLKKTRVNFSVYQFNEDIDMPRFKRQKTLESTSTYLNAGDALTSEFFSK